MHYSARIDQLVFNPALQLLNLTAPADTKFFGYLTDLWGLGEMTSGCQKSSDPGTNVAPR